MTEATLVTLDWCREGVAKVKKYKGDPEMAHSYEDELHINLLEAIAEGRCTNPQECSKIVLQTLELDFDRWCA